MLKTHLPHSRLIATIDRENLVVIIVLGLLVIAWTLDSILNPAITSTDLNMSATIVAKDMNPSLYPRDNLFATDELYRFYTPLYRWLVLQVWRAGGSFETGLILLVPVVLGLYLVCMFILQRRVTNNLWIALMMTIISAHYHPTVGAGLWGVAGSSEMAPRILFMPITLIITLIFIGLLEKPDWRYGAILGLAFGLSTNLHPVSGFHLLVLFLVWLFLVEGGSRKGWQTLIVLGLTAFVGALPVTWNYVNNSGQPVDTGVTFAAFSKIVAERYPMPFFPSAFNWPLFNLELTRPTLDLLAWFYLGLALVSLWLYLWGHCRWPGMVRWGWLVGGLITVVYGYMLTLFNATLIFAVVGFYVIYCFWRGKYPRLTRWMLTLAGLIVLYAFVGYYVLTFIWQKFEVWALTSLLIEYARAGSFIYLSIYLLAGLALATWWQDLKTRIPQTVGQRLWWGALVLLVVLVFGLFGPLAPWLADVWPLPSRNLLNPANLQTQPVSNPVDTELYDWVLRNTSPDSLFYGCLGPETMTYFRRKAQRSITHNWKDLAYNVHNRTTLWSAYNRFRELETACKTFDGIVSTAHAIGADYILIGSQDAAAFAHQACFVNDRYAVFALRPNGCD